MSLATTRPASLEATADASAAAASHLRMPPLVACLLLTLMVAACAAASVRGSWALAAVLIVGVARHLYVVAASARSTY